MMQICTLAFGQPSLQIYLGTLYSRPVVGIGDDVVALMWMMLDWSYSKFYLITKLDAYAHQNMWYDVHLLSERVSEDPTVLRLNCSTVKHN